MGDYKSLAEALNKTYGEGTAFILGKNEAIEIPRWSLSSLKISDLLGGGLPQSRIIEIFGPESSGKTSLCYYFAGQVQRQGGKIAIIDSENSTDLEYASTFGLIPEEIIVIQPKDGEQAFDVARDIVKSNDIDLLIIDSVAALTPRSFVEGETGDASMGVHARLMSKGLMTLNSAMMNSHTTVLFTNQTRNKIGGYGNPETTTGGLSLRYYTSVRLETRKKEFIWSGKENESDILGMIFKLSTKKSKVSTPMRFKFVTIMFGSGIDTYTDVMDYGVELGFIQKSGSWYSYGEQKIGQGIDKVVAFMKENPKIYAAIDENVRKVLFKKKGRTPVSESIVSIESDKIVVENGYINDDEKIDLDSFEQEESEMIESASIEEPKKRGRKPKGE